MFPGLEIVCRVLRHGKPAAHFRNISCWSFLGFPHLLTQEMQSPDVFAGKSLQAWIYIHTKTTPKTPESSKSHMAYTNWSSTNWFSIFLKVFSSSKTTKRCNKGKGRIWGVLPTDPSGLPLNFEPSKCNFLQYLLRSIMVISIWGDNDDWGMRIQFFNRTQTRNDSATVQAKDLNRQWAPHLPRPPKHSQRVGLRSPHWANRCWNPVGRSRCRSGCIRHGFQRAARPRTCSCPLARCSLCD